MVNYVNYSKIYEPVDFGRINIYNRYEQHAQNARNAALANCGCGNSYLNVPLFNFSSSPPYSGFGFNMPMMGYGCMPFGFGYTNSYMAGTVIGQTIGLGINAVKQWLS